MAFGRESDRRGIQARGRRGVLWLLFAVVLTGGTMADGQVVINEIHYDPDIKTEPVEFIELYNAGATPADLSGWYFSEGITYTFPAGTTLAADGYIVVAENVDFVKTKFGLSVGVVGPFVGILSNDGEAIVLRDASGVKMDEVSYQCGFPWPTASRGGGASMELINPSFDNDLGGNWRPSGGYAQGASPQTLIYEQSDWRYRKGTSEPSDPVTAWSQLSFAEDATWYTGQAPVGYGESVVLTPLDDMRYNYTSVYFRKTFTVSDLPSIPSLILQALYDDGINVWINGTHLCGQNVSGSELPSTATALSAGEDLSYREYALPDPTGYLVAGANIITVQLLNSSLSDGSDAFFDARLIAAPPTISKYPTPGARNSVYSTQSPTCMRQVEHTPKQPLSGEAVTVSCKITDPAGVSAVTLQYQLVNPGAYIRLSDAEYQTNWTNAVMLDDGLNGDSVAGDSVYSVQLPGSLQTNRRLVRYRITAQNTLGKSLTAPYTDDPQPDFAYFVYDGVPAWTGAVNPNGQSGRSNYPQDTPVTYDANVMRSLPVYHLISREVDVLDCQYNSAYNDGVYRFYGTVVYDGDVYDHVRYRIKGTGSTYEVGKNKWKFHFNTGHSFQARDNYGRKYNSKWDKLVYAAGTSPWWQYPHPQPPGDSTNWDEATDGMVINEAIGMRFYQLAGVAASNHTFLHYRIIDRASETGATQYDSDFWGLYIAIEQPDGRFLDERDLPDGNLYKMAGSGTHSTNQGPYPQVSNLSDVNTFKSASTGYNRTSPSYQPYIWWEANVNLPLYYSYHAVSNAINNTDRRPEWNCLYYRHPVTNQWWVIPWDLDPSFEYGPHYGPNPSWGHYESQNMEHFCYVFFHDAAWIAYQNRARELLDLLFNADEGARLIDEYAGFITKASGGRTFAQADRAMWDYHPRKTRKGIFYTYNEYLTNIHNLSFPGVVRYLKRYITTQGWPSGVWPTTSYNSPPYVYGGLLLAQDANDPNIPGTPTITYSGTAGYPANDLRFQSSAFSSATPGAVFDGMQWRVGEITDTTAPGFTWTTPQKYEVEAVWESGELPAFQNQVTVPATACKAGHTYRARVRMNDNTGRYSHWSAPVPFVAGAPSNAVSLRDNLRVTELMFDPPAGADYEFVELRNTSSNTPLDLSGVAFTNGITYTFPAGATLAPGAYVVVVRAGVAGNFAAFRAYYGLDASATILGPYTGKLDDQGEHVTLKTAGGAGVILEFDYNNARGWPLASQGGGHSMVPLLSAIAAESSGSLNYGGNWRAGTYIKGSPGAPDPEPPVTVLINEFAAHTDYQLPYPNDSNDWIELHNPPSAPAVSLGPNWYLSDDVTDLKKWALPAGSLAPGAFTTFDEINDFHKPASMDGFGLDKMGEQVVLSYLPGNSQDRIVDCVTFKGQENATTETLGRYPNDNSYWYKMSPTRNASNTAPHEHLAISEIMYHPLGNDKNSEYVEIHNPTSQPISLGRNPGMTARLDGGVQYLFPPNITLPPGGYLLVTNFYTTDTLTLNAFLTSYTLTAPLPIIVGPYQGDLSNMGERVALEYPHPADPPRTDVPFWVINDEVIYFDQAPFPPEADGTGFSLQRKSNTVSGNDPANWAALPPGPGKQNPATIASVETLAATGVDYASATLSGNLLSTGGLNPVVRIYWGTTDGGADEAGWQHHENLGVRPAGLFSASLSDLLLPGTTYYYRCHAQNLAGEAWALSSQSFKTDVVYILTVTAEHGSVVKSPDKVLYAPDELVALTAVPEYGFVFFGWLGDVAVSQRSNNPVEITMDTSKNVVARFVRGTTASASDLWLLY